MNSDATEAALGLLGLSPLNAPQSQQQPHHPHVAHAHGPSLTSTAVGIAIDRRSSSNHVQSALPPSFVPLKRKQPSPALPTTARGTSPTTTTPLPTSTSRDTLSIKSAQRQSSHPLATSSTPPIKSTRPLPNVSTKSSTGPSRRYSQQRSFSPSLNTALPPQTPPTAQLPLASPSTSQHPLSLADPPPPPDSDAISCICGFTYDDGFSIACDDCSRWCHAACFGIVQGEVPEFWKCWVCNPEVEVDKERAVKIQKGRLKAMRLKASHGANGGAAGATSLNGLGVNPGMDDGSGGTGKPVSRRKTSPGVERKPRRGSAVAAAIDGSGPSKKRRRASILAPIDPSSSSSAMGPPTSNQAGPSTQPHSFHASSSRISLPNGPPVANPSNANPTPITFPPDIYPHPSTHAQLLRAARAWRGVTALNPPSPLINPPRTYIDGGYTRVASQEYGDRYGYSMSPLDNTTPVILDENAGDIFIPRTVLRTDPPSSYSQPLRHPQTHLYSASHVYPNIHLLSNTPSAATHTPSSSTHTPPHLLRPPSPRLHVATEPSPFVQAAACATSPVSNSSVPYPTPSTSLHPQPRSYAKSPLTSSTNTTPSLNTHSTPSLNTSHTIPASTLLAPYTATIVPSSAYLADPLNGYAHLGMGKPQVRLVGGGWGVGIDAREIGGSRDDFELGDKGGTGAGKEGDAGGGKARWARCGCWPNAVLRPVICAGTRAAENKGEKGRQHKAGCGKAGAVSTDIKDNEPPRTPDDESSAALPKTQPRAQSRRTDDSSDQEDPTSDSDTDPTTLSFALFALRDLKAEEEIVLGWEWDDGHAVHMLPALMESPGMFGPAYLHHLRAQFTSILHALSSTFTMCACGSSTRDCAVRVMERVVEGRWPWPGREMTPEGSGDESSEGEQGWEDGDGDGDVDVEGDGDGGVNMAVDLAMEIDIDGRPRSLKKRKVRKKSKDKDKDRPNPKGALDLGPLVGVKRGFMTREKVPMSGGWCGVEVVPSSLVAFPDLGTDGEEKVSVTRKGKGKGGKVGKGKTKVDDVVLKPGVPDKDDMDVDDSTPTMPPRMRKPWVQSPASQSEDHSPREHRQGAEIWGWRSPPETNAESPVSVSGADVEGNVGQNQGVTARSASVNGNGHDGVDGQDAEFDTDTDTEADAVDDTRQMPPPPMPASLDPTTVSSLAHACGRRSASPRLPVQWEKSGSPRVSTTWIPPQAPTPTSATTARTSQSPNQTHHPATPALSYTSAPASSPPPLVHKHDTLSSASLPSPTHAETQPHSSALAQTQLAQAQLLPPTVSPSAPFSQLSLHSPDATSLSPHQSVLFGSGEGTFLSPASAPAPESIYSIPRKQVSPPPPHKPSKPLHVHPQNESPSVPAPVSVPIVRIESPDATRDTPTQAQHKHKHRSSPESSHHTLGSPDGEKARTAEAHRVRFASPEVLSGLPGLIGKAEMGDIKDADVSVEDDVVQVDGDAMDVDIDVVGDESSGDGSGPGHRPFFDRRRLHRISKDEAQPLHAATSPRSEPQLLPQSLTVPEPLHSPAPEHDSLPLSPQTQHPPSESGSELMLSEPEPQQPTREASPPPPPKVKMSLKDFALRKKKQREEEMAAKALTSPGSPDDHGLPPSPNVDGKRDLAVDNAGGAEENEEKVGFPGVVNDVDVQMKDATVTHARDVSFPSVNGNGVNVELNGRHDDDPSVSQRPPKPVQDQQASLVAKKTGVMVIAPPPEAAQPSPRFAPSLTPLPRASDESTVQTQINGRTGAAPVTLKAKVEMMDSVIPSGLVAADGDCAADAVSFAPEPPPPPLTTKQTSDANVAEGRRTTAPASTPTPSISSRSTSTGITVSAPSHPDHVPHAHIPTNIPLSRKPSHEDGEITSSTPPKTYLPRSYTPPTQPRSFHATHPPSPNLGPTSSSSSSSSAPASRRPAPPPLSRSPLSNAAGPAPVPISSRPLPSGPRALRGSMSQTTQPPPYTSTRPPYVGSQYIPRGPSADRDRLDWDRDRQWAASSRSRGRAGSNGWGR